MASVMFTFHSPPNQPKEVLLQKFLSVKFHTKKSVDLHVYLSHWSGARGHQRLPTLKYYNLLKWESRFTLGINIVKNTNYIRKRLN